ncbi:MAG TPA: methyl-accepting chemotaxis protein [Burkholderiales bacterium]|nr:methyl-accepting chemotaxis protein [Burkholderiales bacterium]
MVFKLPGRKPKAKQEAAGLDEATVILPAPPRQTSSKTSTSASRPGTSPEKDGGRKDSRLDAPGSPSAPPATQRGRRSAAQPVVRPLALIGGLPVSRQYGVLGLVLLILAALAAATVVLDRRQAADGAVYLATAANMRVLTQRIAKAAEGVTSGNADLFPQLQSARGELADSLKLLMQGGQAAGRTVPASSDAVQPVLDELARDWMRTERNIGVLLAQRKGLAGAATAGAALDAARQRLRELAADIPATRPRGRTQDAAALPQRLAAWLERPLPATAEAMEDFGRNAAALHEQLAAAKDGADDAAAAQKLADMDTAVTALQDAVITAVGGALAQSATVTAARQITDDSEILFNESQKVVQAYETELTGRTGNFVVLGVLALLAAVVTWLMVRVYVAEERRRTEDAERQRAETERSNTANQDAILRLMNEMSVLAEGDLRARATVSEDITGAIADAVNFTVEELAKLVSRINGASSQLSAAATTAQRSSDQLLAAADYQSKEIRASSATVLGMAEAMTRISGGASQSADVAGQSLAAARRGREAVEAAIAGMDGIRVQIQETAKRMKRLGESSQEIGEIVELIADITEQTNVLALNASIQAAAAGEAGRGFSVVAEEVQRLAERSSSATRRIGAIVKTIQADTQETVAAMEKSTQGVVEGARLSDAAGKTLEEIGTVSSRLARLIAEIKSITEEQGRTAQTVAANMQSVLTITEQTSAGTKRTAQSIEQLSQLAQSLKASVANFKI